MHSNGLDMNPMLLLPIVILQLILLIVSIVDLVKRDKDKVTGENKLFWAIIILLIGTIGPILYLTLGRKK